jgi:hypothetical protein
VSEANRYSAAFGRFLAASRSAWMRATASSTCRDGAAGTRGEDREAAAAASSAKLRMVGSRVYRLPCALLADRYETLTVRYPALPVSVRPPAQPTRFPPKVIALAASHP